MTRTREFTWFRCKTWGGTARWARVAWKVSIVPHPPKNGRSDSNRQIDIIYISQVGRVVSSSPIPIFTAPAPIPFFYHFRISGIHDINASESTQTEDIPFGSDNPIREGERCADYRGDGSGDISYTWPCRTDPTSRHPWAFDKHTFECPICSQT